MQLPAPAAKTSHFAYFPSYGAANIAPVSGIDERVADGPYVLDVIVEAGDPAPAEAPAPQLAAKLDARFRLARKGRLHAKPVKLPKQKAGPPRGRPDLSVSALRIFMARAKAVSSADVTAIAQAAANRIDAAGLGS